MATYYTMRSPKGKWLNTDYHSRNRHGKWRDEENRRLYKSLLGLRQAAAYCVLDGFRGVLPGLDLQCSSDWRRRMEEYALVNKLTLTEWVDLCEKCGYTFHEHQV